MRLFPGRRPAPTTPSRLLSHRRGWRERGKQAAVALALVGSALVAGPVAPATAVATPAPAPLVTAAPEPVRVPVVDRQAEQALGARLATEYAGAVQATDVERLVRRVVRQLRREASPPERLLHTAEAMCRRALTDFLARGVPLALS
ncbi:hypothetical protein I601_4075 [Nocardioides dokdonensis FR1436]|uniref:Uncharacterized protein n=1 Tax=Nocardioides dokdonensis FR1436 TaxID=1300347 RepID=A0A1A9GSQ9_9ACTN|nr:hypothetical protein [Nocardioides dokdonensis]ANH40471.1 hypothetical protein I601_4075 [Nocardioides dokdonensis FR1436]